LGRTQKNGSHTPIKEEDIEDDFDDGGSHTKSKYSKQTGGTSGIIVEEANNNNFGESKDSEFYDADLGSTAGRNRT
jgi:hypothetical protein